MKKFVSVLLSWILAIWVSLAMYIPTAVDVQIVDTFSAKITMMYNQNPAKITSIAPKLGAIVSSFSDETREHYVLNSLYQHILDLITPPTTITQQIVVTQPEPAPVVAIQPAPTTSTEPISWSNDIEMINSLIDSGYVKWNPDAEFTIIKFSDYQCPYCQSYQIDNVLNNVVSHYDNKVNYVIAHYISSKHALAMQAALWAECIWEQLWSQWYYQYTDELFKPNHFKLQPTRSNMDIAFDAINSNGIMDKTEFNACIDSNKYAQKINSSSALLRELNHLNETPSDNPQDPYNIVSTPTVVFFNNSTGQYKYIKWWVSLAAWKDVISELEPNL